MGIADPQAGPASPSFHGEVIAKINVQVSAPLASVATDCFEIGSDRSSPVLLDCFDQTPYKFDGTIGTTRIKCGK